MAVVARCVFLFLFAFLSFVLVFSDPSFSLHNPPLILLLCPSLLERRDQEENGNMWSLCGCHVGESGFYCFALSFSTSSSYHLFCFVFFLFLFFLFFFFFFVSHVRLLLLRIIPPPPFFLLILVFFSLFCLCVLFCFVLIITLRCCYHPSAWCMWRWRRCCCFRCLCCCCYCCRCCYR